MKGIGTDIVAIGRFTAILERQGEKFIERVLTPAERETYRLRGEPISFLAKRFAAKEATAKALGTGIGRGVSFQHIEICSSPDGVPLVVLSAGALAAANALGGEKVLLSLSDEADYAIAYAALV